MCRKLRTEWQQNNDLAHTCRKLRTEGQQKKEVAHMCRSLRMEGQQNNEVAYSEGNGGHRGSKTMKCLMFLCISMQILSHICWFRKHKDSNDTIIMIWFTSAHSTTSTAGENASMTALAKASMLTGLQLQQQPQHAELQAWLLFKQVQSQTGCSGPGSLMHITWFTHAHHMVGSIPSTWAEEQARLFQKNSHYAPSAEETWQIELDYRKVKVEVSHNKSGNVFLRSGQKRKQTVP